MFFQMFFLELILEVCVCGGGGGGGEREREKSHKIWSVRNWRDQPQ